MNRLHILSLALVLAAPGVPALAAEPAAEPETPSEAAPPDAKPVLICKTLSETGSRIGSKKVCMTRKQWDAHRAAAQDRTRRAQKIQGATNGN